MAPPSPVHRVANGREVLAASVVSDRACEPSRLAAHSTKAPDGLCRQYASRPLEDSGSCPPEAPLDGAVGLSASTLP